METYDPEKIQEQINEITSAEFGRLIASVIKKYPSSSNWFLVNKVIEIKTGWDAEHDQVAALIERMSQ